MVLKNLLGSHNCVLWYKKYCILSNTKRIFRAYICLFMQNIHECFRQKNTLTLFDREGCTFCAYLCVYAIYGGVYTSVWFAVDRYFFDLAHGEALYYTFLFTFSFKNCTQLQRGSRRQGELHLNCCSCKLLGVKVSRVFSSLATFTLSPRVLYTFLSTHSFPKL